MALRRKVKTPKIEVQRKQRWKFLGIGNWALEPTKMVKESVARQRLKRLERRKVILNEEGQGMVGRYDKRKMAFGDVYKGVIKNLDRGRSNTKKRLKELDRLKKEYKKNPKELAKVKEGIEENHRLLRLSDRYLDLLKVKPGGVLFHPKKVQMALREMGVKASKRQVENYWRYKQALVDEMDLRARQAKK